MRSDFDFRYRSIELRSVDVCTFANDRPVIVRGISAELRERLGLPCTFEGTQKYLRLKSIDGTEAWQGPFTNGSGITTSALAANWKLVGTKTSIACALEALGPVWYLNPSVCSAIESVLWDLACRTEQLPLWRSLRPNGCKARLGFYGSALGLASNDIDALIGVIAAGYSVAKWTIDPRADISAQIQRIGALGVPWQAIALDAHCGLEISQAESINRKAPGLAWLEDPFPSGDHPGWTVPGLPPLVSGERLYSADALLAMAVLPEFFAVNLEVERLGITRACDVIRALNARGRICLLHGRAMILSSHLAAAFPETVRAVENHLVYAPERLATVCPKESTFEPWRITNVILTRPGCGAEPEQSAELVACEEVY